jgi:hypothetical protein
MQVRGVPPTHGLRGVGTSQVLKLKGGGTPYQTNDG